MWKKIISLLNFYVILLRKCEIIDHFNISLLETNNLHYVHVISHHIKFLVTKVCQTGIPDGSGIDLLGISSRPQLVWVSP